MKIAIDYAVANGGAGIIDTLPSWYAFFQKYVTSAQAVCPISILHLELHSVSILCRLLVLN